VREAHGFVWLWWGSRDEVADDLRYFPQLEQGWRHHTVTVNWPVHYTRAIENQLDVAHLPFVHPTTIGAGGPVRSLPELAATTAGTDPGLDFLFPGVWLLNIGPRLRNFIAFVPINESATRYYLRNLPPFQLRT
jgi:phenylpropionate dioxygenase-like ring-hydroxylating dioxygenase large terminal subunit